MKLERCIECGGKGYVLEWCSDDDWQPRRLPCSTCGPRVVHAESDGPQELRRVFLTAEVL